MEGDSIPKNDNVELKVAANELFRLKKQEKEIREQCKFLSEKLKEGVQNRTTRIGPYLFKKSIRKGGVDYKSIPELKGLDLDAYRKAETTAWSLLIVE